MDRITGFDRRSFYFFVFGFFAFCVIMSAMEKALVSLLKKVPDTFNYPTREQMSKRDSNIPGQEPEVCNESVWTTVITIFIIIGIGLCIGFCLILEILPLKTLLIFAAIFLPAAFFIRVLIYLVVCYVKSKKAK
ncbi:hypothetical protein ACFL3G_01475 [Planctomycetota bacterium]